MMGKICAHMYGCISTNNGSVSTSLGQRYLDNILKLALGSNREQALSAIELIGSILRQGLVHPNQVSLLSTPWQTKADG